ncbi:MAG: hypothetical protein ACRDNP_04870, partial [Gaiellaceae bacterium]
MSDTVSQLSERELAELAALADGTLPADRRAEVEARVAASPKLRELLEHQRQSVALTQALEADEPRASLQTNVEALRWTRARTRGRRLAPRLTAVGLAVAAAVVAAVVLTG